MEGVWQYFLAGLVAIAGPVLTLFNLPGNGLMLVTGLGLIFFYPKTYFQLNYVLAFVLTYLIGETWEFIISFFGIKKEKVSWAAVFLIGCGGFIGTLVGTGMLPVLGSFLGGVIGAFLAAFLYEYLRSRKSENALHLAWVAAKMRFLALLGKIIAAMVMAVILIKMIVMR